MADPEGNIAMEREALTLDNLAMAMAAKNSRGFVIAQVERTAASNTLNPRTMPRARRTATRFRAARRVL
jgi:propionate CoA-transferase